MRESALPRLPRRKRDAHKGDFGRVFIVAGSRGMTGAAALAGMGALRSGAGLVYLAVPASCWSVVASLEPGYLTVPLAEDGEGRVSDSAWTVLDDWAARVDVAAIGPGLGQSDSVRQFVRECYQRWSTPLVVDADALNALSHVPARLSRHAGPRVLTPHPGEFRRLLGGADCDREMAIEFARRHDVVLVLKGHQTLVTDGERAYGNTTGNPGMATGGTGDVLTGVIAALLGQGLAPFEAAQLGVWVHGRAGDLQAARVGEISLTARDLVEGLPQAWLELPSA